MSRPDSWYSATALLDTAHPQLNGDHRFDVVIVGGGLTGVASALELTERGYSVAIVESRRVGWGATGRNGGQITGSLSGDSAMTRQLRQKMGSDAAQFVWNLRWRGHEIISQRVSKYSINCDLKHGHLHAAFKPSHMKELQETYDAACRNGMQEDVSLVEKTDLPSYIGTSIYCGGLLNRRNMHVHSLNLCLGEAAAAVSLGARIFENSEVISIEHGEKPSVITATGKIRADAVLLAGNAYHRLERSTLSGMLFPAALANMTTDILDADVASAINPQDLAVYDTRFVLDYYRLTSDKRLMFGGGANYSGRNPVNIKRLLCPAMIKTFPILKNIDIAYSWTGLAGITVNRIPQFGRIADSVFYAQGYSGHGIATSHIAGEIMANAISGNLEEFDLFSNFRHWRIPFGDIAGQTLLTLGMFYYQLKERLS